MTSRELLRRAGEIRWYHTIDLGQGVVTQGVDNSPYRLARIQMPEDLSGRSVLDVGAWDGFYAFEAERRGARRVVAADYYAWHGQGWGTRNGKAGFELAREAKSSHVDDIDVDVMDLTPERIGVFEVVLFLGLLYHLRDPLGALARVYSVASDLVIVETVVDMVGFSRPVVAFYPGRELNNDPTNWWGPNHAAVVGMLQATGFRRVETITPVPSAIYRGARAILHTIKDRTRISRAFRQDRAVFHAYR